MLRSSALKRTFSRSYIVPSFEHLNKDRGLSGLFSKEGLQSAWFDRAEHYTEKLNSYTANTDEKPLETIIHENANISSKKQIFNYASLLYNLKFSMSSLKGSSLPLPTEKLNRSELLKTPELTLTFGNEPLSMGNERLHQALVQSFGSIVEFRSLLLNSNNAISGDGYTWLVARQFKTADPSAIKFDQLFIVNTYNAGSPFNSNRAGSFKHLQESIKKKTEGFKADKLESAVDAVMYPGTKYFPLLAIDASPKAWLPDYGVFGKQQYLDSVWESIEWKVVENRLPAFETKAFATL
ncbi:Mrp1 [Kluyveromyces lactis]|nr:Mrp1 [Kluyveromyces lactis]